MAVYPSGKLKFCAPPVARVLVIMHDSSEYVEPATCYKLRTTNLKLAVNEWAQYGSDKKLGVGLGRRLPRT